LGHELNPPDALSGTPCDILATPGSKPGITDYLPATGWAFVTNVRREIERLGVRGPLGFYHLDHLGNYHPCFPNDHSVTDSNILLFYLILIVQSCARDC
jgi:hypothetical protein